MVMLSIPLLVEMVKLLAVQFVTAKFEVCWRMKALEAGQETITLFPDRVTVRVGAPRDCTTDTKLQKPPVKE